ncbi:hypothetical protein AURDEDRAFT_111108 [Auricularia subglabra TFB-10046 SS5]|nr:hypothetical protein AURDEDRAFT_111108 [Auricularia subglabra TFB-10046 SS5]
METGASNAVRARRPMPTHAVSEPRRQRTAQRPTPTRHQSAYPYQPMPVSFLSDSSTSSSSESEQTASSHSHSHSQTSSHSHVDADPVSRFGIPYANRSRPSLEPGTPRASFSASSDSSAYPRTPGSQDSGRTAPLAQEHWREASVDDAALQQDAWLAHVAEQMSISLKRLADSVRAAQDEMAETRRVLDERRRKVLLLAASVSTESWSASAFDPDFQGPRTPLVPASRSGDSYYSSSTSDGQVAAPSFFTAASTTSSISYSSTSYSEAANPASPSYSSFYTMSPSASASQGSFA